MVTPTKGRRGRGHQPWGGEGRGHTSLGEEEGGGVVTLAAVLSQLATRPVCLV